LSSNSPLVVLTGGSGFLGRYVLSALNKRGIETVSVGRKPILGTKNFVQMDLLNQQDFSYLFSFIRPSHLIHLAWCAEHGKFWDSLINLEWVEASAKLAKAFYESGGEKIVGIGSGAEYEPNHEKCVVGLTPIKPNSLYGASKALAKQMMELFRKEASLVWGRVFIPFGRGEDDDRLIPSLEQVFSFQTPPFKTNGEAYRDFLHAEDVAEGIITLLLSGVSGEYNICSGRSIQIKEVIKRMAKEYGADPKPMFNLMVNKPNEPKYYCGDNSKLISLGWSPNLDKHEITREE